MSTKRDLAACWTASGAGAGALLALMVLVLPGCATPPEATPETVTADRQLQRVLRSNECLKCHSVTRSKTGPAWREVAEKYRGQGDAETRLVNHLTTRPIIDLDGNPETHRAVKEMSPAQVRNLARWILSL